MTKWSDWHKRLFIASFLLPGLALYTLFVAYPAAEGLRISLMGEGLNISLRLVLDGATAGGSWGELARRGPGTLQAAAVRNHRTC